MFNEEELRGELGFRVDCRDKSLATKAMMATFLADDLEDDDVDLITDVMTHAAATPRGTYETSTQVLAELSRDVQDPRQGPIIPAKVPSWNTYRRALLDFGQDPVEGNEEPEAEPEPEPELVKAAGKARLSEKDFDYTSEGTFRKHVQLGYDVRKVNQHIDGVCRATFLAATDLARRRDDLPLFIINKDGNPHPLYAESWKYGKSAERHGPQDGKDFTPIGRLGSGAFRDKGPMYPGTVNKLEYYVMSAHFLETNETFCLGFRWGAPNPRSQISMRDELEKYPDAPILMMSDKGFASEEFTRNDRAYCDPRGTIMITPLPRWAWVREIVADLWNSGEAKAVPGAGKTLLYGQRRANWADLKVLPFNVAVFFTEEDPEDYLEDPEAFGVFELAPKLFAVAFYTNLEVDHPEVAKWFEAQYSGRWACENLYKRAKALLGRSQGQTPFPRHLWYAFGMFVIAGLGLWRLRQRIRIDFWDAWTRGISRNLFLDPMKRFIERRFESPKAPKK